MSLTQLFPVTHRKLTEKDRSITLVYILETSENTSIYHIIYLIIKIRQTAYYYYLDSIHVLDTFRPIYMIRHCSGQFFPVESKWCSEAVRILSLEAARCPEPVSGVLHSDSLRHCILLSSSAESSISRLKQTWVHRCGSGFPWSLWSSSPLHSDWCQ